MGLRDRSEMVVGCVAKPVRIFKIDCRFEGSDCQIEVGKPLPGDHGDALVTAILDHGRDESFAVFTVEDSVQPTRVTRPAYEVTAFS
jgi:hypothetical protein